MKLFSELVQVLETTNKTNAKITALVNYLEKADSKDSLWMVALFTGKRPRRTIVTKLLKEWIIEISQIPEWLFVESYSAVGDLGETISLLLPEPQSNQEKTLSRWIEEISLLKNFSDKDKKEYVLNAWNSLDVMERLIFNKLIGGSFRVGVSNKIVTSALAQFTNREPSAIMHGIMGIWDPNTTTLEELLLESKKQENNSKPYPFCLAYPLEKELNDLGNTSDWQIEYKWDGIRGQFIKRNGEIFIWSRGEELVTNQFPEIHHQLEKMSGDFVLDGEILPIKEGNVLSFNSLQKRLNRKNITQKLMNEVPVGVYAYDIVEENGKDLRNLPLFERRERLNQIIGDDNTSSVIKKSKIINCEEWKDLHLFRENASSLNSEGLMLKKSDSLYHSGRKKGDWWKWKLDPLTLDAVLIYAQKGSGRRSGYYTDYTFAVRDGEKLVSIAKAYSGLTDKEIVEVSRFVTKNALEKFGPVRTVKPELVFEIAFEGISFSSRHKSGVALRFPRILRWRKDKTIHDVDELQEIKKMIK